MNARSLAAVFVLVAVLLGVVPYSAFAQTLSFDRYRESVEPIFLVERGGYGPGRSACVTCHAKQGTPLKLQPLQEDDTGGVFWSEHQSRQNFETVASLVAAGDPDNSRLLLKALAVPAGGASFHVGGKFFLSRTDPEWRAMADWVAAAASLPSGSAVAAPELDFEFFHGCVQRVFLDKREGLMECINCHDAGARGFAQTIREGRDYWSRDEARQNLSLLSRYIEPGHPLRSRFLTHPLAPEGGGDHFHGGGRRWGSQDDPEWQMLAAWVRGESPECLSY